MGIKERFGYTARETGSDSAQSTGAEILPVRSADHNPDRELRRFRMQHKWDPFLDNEKLDNIDDALASGDAEKEAAIDESLIQEDSPYPEVRSSVSRSHTVPFESSQLTPSLRSRLSTSNSPSTRSAPGPLAPFSAPLSPPATSSSISDAPPLLLPRPSSSSLPTREPSPPPRARALSAAAQLTCLF